MTGLLRRLRGRAPAAPGAAPGTLELRGAGARVVLVPELGGRITALELGGRQWLHEDAAAARSALRSDGESDAPGPVGGLDECFPTLAACTIEGAGGAGPLALPARGELAAQRAEMQVETTPDGNVATSVWRGRLLPYRLERRVRVAPTGEVEMCYVASNEGGARLPYLWAAEALFPLTKTTRIVVADGTAVRVGESQGLVLGARGAEHRWPHARLEKSIVDLSRPARVARRYASRLFLQPWDGRVAVEQDGARLELTVDPARVPALGLWLNHRGARMGGERSPSVIGLAPATGAPDSLSDALGDWRGARWLAPGERHEWSMTWRVPPAAPPAG